jgi:hypothetical protein
MIKEALKYLVKLDRPVIEDINGQTWCNRDLYRVMPPTPEPLVTDTLRGVVDYIVSVSDEIDRLDEKTKLIVHVVNSRLVRLVSSVQTEYQRWTLVKAECTSNNRWRWGEYMSQQNFIIAAKQSFAWDGQLQRVLQIVSSMVEDNQTESIDNGTTQRVYMKHGVEVRQDSLPEFFSLALANWWPDLPAPASDCFLRVDKGLRVALMDVCRPARESELRANMANWIRLQIGDYCKSKGITIPIIV